MAEDSDLEKSEAPTPHRLQKARREGQVPRSKELVSWLMLLSGWSLLWLAGDDLARGMGRMLQSGLSFDLHINGEGSWLLAQFSGLVRQALLVSAPLFLGVTLVAAGSPMLIGGVLFSSKAVSLDLKRLNPFSGLKRLFSMQMMAELTKTLFKRLSGGRSLRHRVVVCLAADDAVGAGGAPYGHGGKSVAYSPVRVTYHPRPDTRSGVRHFVSVIQSSEKAADVAP